MVWNISFDLHELKRRTAATEARSHRDEASFVEEFGRSQLWRRSLNHKADEIAGNRASAAQDPLRFRCVLEVDRLAYAVNHHLADIARQVPEKADKSHFAKNRKDGATGSQVSSAPVLNKKQRWLLKLAGDDGHEWEVTSKEAQSI